MPGSAAKVLITERQQEVLQELVAGRTTPVRFAQRATIVLLAFAKMDNADIADEIGLGPDAACATPTLGQGLPRLTVFECAENKVDLRRAIVAVLGDKPRSGNPGKFTPEQITSILALACEPPEKSGRPITHWTNAELADEAMKQGIVPSISAAQVGRYLREAELQPHRSKYWLNTKEKDPAQFQTQGRRSVRLLSGSAALVRRRGNAHGLHRRDDRHPGAGADRANVAAGQGPDRVPRVRVRETWHTDADRQFSRGDGNPGRAETWGRRARRPTLSSTSPRRWRRTRRRRGCS